MSGSFDGYDMSLGGESPIVLATGRSRSRVKDASKAKHTENEAARRNRERERFAALQSLLSSELESDNDRTSRVHVLQVAIESITAARSKIAALEAQVAQMALNGGASANAHSNASVVTTTSSNSVASSPSPSQELARMLAAQQQQQQQQHGGSGNSTPHYQAQQQMALQQYLVSSGGTSLFQQQSPMSGNQQHFSNTQAPMMIDTQLQDQSTSLQSTYPVVSAHTPTYPSSTRHSRANSSDTVPPSGQQQQQQQRGHSPAPPSPSRKRSFSQDQLAPPVMTNAGIPTLAHVKFERQQSGGSTNSSFSGGGGAGELTIDTSSSAMARMVVTRGPSPSHPPATTGIAVNVPDLKRRRTGDQSPVSGCSSVNNSPRVSPMPHSRVLPSPLSALSPSQLSAAAAEAAMKDSLPPFLAAQASCLMTLDGQVLEASQPFLDQLSARAEHVIGQNVFSLLHPSESVSTLTAMQQLLRTGTGAEDELYGVDDQRRLFLRGAGITNPAVASPPNFRPGSPSLAATTISLRLVLFIVADRGGNGRLRKMLAVSYPWDSQIHAPRGFTLGATACLEVVATQCAHLLDLSQQKYLVTVLYGVPKSKLTSSAAHPPPVANVATHTPPHSQTRPIVVSASPSMRASMSHQNLTSLIGAAGGVSPSPLHARTGSLAHHHSMESPLAATASSTSSTAHHPQRGYSPIPHEPGLHQALHHLTALSSPNSSLHHPSSSAPPPQIVRSPIEHHATSQTIMFHPTPTQTNASPNANDLVTSTGGNLLDDVMTPFATPLSPTNFVSSPNLQAILPHHPDTLFTSPNNFSAFDKVDPVTTPMDGQQALLNDLEVEEFDSVDDGLSTRLIEDPGQQRFEMPIGGEDGLSMELQEEDQRYQ